MRRYRVELRNPQNITIAIVEMSSKDAGGFIRTVNRMISGWPSCRAVFTNLDTDVDSDAAAITERRLEAA